MGVAMFGSLSYTDAPNAPCRYVTSYTLASMRTHKSHREAGNKVLQAALFLLAHA